MYKNVKESLYHIVKGSGTDIDYQTYADYVCKKYFENNSKKIFNFVVYYAHHHDFKNGDALFLACRNIMNEDRKRFFKQYLYCVISTSDVEKVWCYVVQYFKKYELTIDYRPKLHTIHTRKFFDLNDQRQFLDAMTEFNKYKFREICTQL